MSKASSVLEPPEVANEAAASAPPAHRRQSDLIVGTSLPMAKVLELMTVVARTDIPALILGESGTGKELVARAIHYSSPRATHPFITLNCGAIPETLMEDELFGHVRGAYTGAHSDKKGIFEEADGGSLFFDEIGDLPPSCQIKLLRVLQEFEIRRVGDNRSVRVNVRIIAATNKDLKKEMAEKRFREDLFHRISVLPIQIPPLRERLEDLTLLVDHFVRQFSVELGRTIKGFTPAAMEKLRELPWPGNVRELANRVKQAMVLSVGDVVDPAALSFLSEDCLDPVYPTFRKAKAEFESSYVAQTLRLSAGKVAVAARMAGKDRKDFYDLMKKHSIDPNEYRS